jgi:hypothetical protein
MANFWEKDTPVETSSPKDNFWAKDKPVDIKSAQNNFWAKDALVETPQEVKTANPFKGLAARAANLAGEGVEGVARAAETIGDKLETAMPLTNLTPEQVKDENQLQTLFNFSKNIKDWGKDIGYAPSTQLGQLTSNPLKVVPFIAERIISSTPDMVAAIGVAPAYIAARTNEILNDRLENDNKSWEKATVKDIAAATSAAMLETFLERFATKHLLPSAGPVGGTVAKRIGKETAIQSGTEAIEEGIGYLGGAAGTIKGIDPSQMAQQMIEGAIVGGGLGAGVQGGKEYVSRPKVNDGTSEPSIPSDSLEREAPGGTRRLDEKGLAVLSERLGTLDGRERAINNQLKQVGPFIRDIEAVDPNDPRIAEAYETAKKLSDELKNVQEEKAAVTAELQTVGKEKAFNAPDQMGLDLGAPVEQQGAIPATPKEFDLTAPEGTTGVTAKAEPIQTMEYPTSKMMLVNTGVNPVKNLVSFFKTLKPATATEAQVGEYDAEINKAIEKVAEFQSEAKGLDRTKRLTFLRDFIDRYSTAPEDKQNEMSRLPSALAGMDAENQQALLSDISQFPKLNTVRGMKEFNQQIEDAMLDYTEAKLGRSRESAILPWQTHEDVNTQKDASELQRLGNISEKYMTPEEKAAKTYLTAHAPAGEPFGSALRAAAFDLGAEQGPVFPGQTKEAAQLFRNWAAKNLHTTTLARFDATVNEYRAMGEKINKRTAEEKASEGKGIIGGRTTGKAKGAGFGRMMHPSIETRIANNDLNGALRALSKVGNNWQKELSKKLISLDLKTTIGYDKQEAFAQRLVDQNVGPVRSELLAKLETEFPSVFKQHFSNPQDIKVTFDSLTALKNGKLDVPKETVDASIGQIEIVREAYEASVAVLNASGTYLPNADTLSLNRNRGGNNPNTFLHEVLHAATHWALDPMNYDSLSAEQKQAVQELERTYKIAKELWGTGNEISSIDEFVVESFANPEFQSFLKGIPMPNQKKTLWNKFTDFIKDMFGMGNVLGYTLANANALLQAAPNLSPEAKALNQQGKLGGLLINDTFKAAPKSRSLINRMFSGRPTWDNAKSNMPIYLESVKDSTRKYLLGLFSPRQLASMVGRQIPAFNRFVDLQEAMGFERIKALQVVEDIAKPWTKFQNKEPQKADLTNKLMLSSTLVGLDPDPDPKLQAEYLARARRVKLRELIRGGLSKADALNSPEYKNITSISIKSKVSAEKQADLARAWNNIGPEGQRIYRQVRDFYKAQLNRQVRNIQEKIEKNLLAKGYSLNEIHTSDDLGYKRVAEKFEDNMIEPYFPFKRFGDFWLQIGKGVTKQFYTFESGIERNIQAEQLIADAKKLDPNVYVAEGNALGEMMEKNIKDFGFLQELKDLMHDSIGKTDAETIKNIDDALEQVFLELLPEQSVRRMFIHREGVQGMSQDMIRVFHSTGSRLAYQQTRLKYTDPLATEVRAAEARLDGMDPNEKKKYRDYVNELKKHFNSTLNPPDTGWLAAGLSNLSFIWYMTAPASAIVNALGIPAVAIPVVGARYGITKTTKAMTSFAKKFSSTGFKDKNGERAFPSFANKLELLTEVQRKAYAEMAPLFDITFTHDIMGKADTPSDLYTGRWRKTMNILGAAFHGAEKFNREVVGMASFELAYERAKSKGLTNEKAFDRAVVEAKELTYKSMFDYSTANKPRYLQSAAAKVVFQFKQFPQNMSFLLAYSALDGFSSEFDPTTEKGKKARHDAGQQINADRLMDGQENLDGKDLEAAINEYVKEFKAEGKNRLFGTLGATFLFAGATGLPGWAAFSAMMEILHYLFADEDEEDKPFDFDNWFKNWTADTFGGFVGDSISRGVASQALGIDVADRMSLNGMWFRDQKTQPDMESAAQAYLVSLGGPAIGLGVSFFDALDKLNQGHYERALETVLPAWPKAALKANRLATEGALTLSGDELIPDFSVTEIAAQAIGFQPERLAQKQKANIEEKNAEQEIKHKHDMLLNAYFMAIDTNNNDMQNRILEKIIKFNSANPGKAIYPETLQNSIERRYKQRYMASGTGGVRIDKNLIGQLGEMNKYGNVD